MHISIQHDKNVIFFRKYIPKIYQVYTRFGSDKSIYLVYTWYIPWKTFQGFPDDHLSWYQSDCPITLIVFTISIVINIIIGSSISLVKINKIYNSTSDNNHCIMMYHIETSFPGFSFCLTCWWHTFKFSDGQHCRDHSHNIKLENLTQSLDVQYNNLEVFIHLSHPMKPVPLLPPTATWRQPLPADPQRQLLTLNG